MAYDLYLLLESSVYTKISGVVSETIENVDLFDSSTYRDEPNASYLGSPPITIGQSQSILGDSATPVFDGVVGVGGGSVTNTTLEFKSAVGTNTVFNTGNNSYFDKCDSITHTEPRKWEKTRTRYRWWTALPIINSCSTTSASVVVTMASTTGLTAGMPVVGAGIPTGTVVSHVTNATDITISQPATDTITTSLIFQSGNLIGWAWADQIVAASPTAFGFIGSTLPA